MLVREHLNADRDLAGKTVLEIGCGRGGFACWLASHPQRPSKVVAVDSSPTAVRKGAEFASRNRIPGTLWEVGDIQAIAHPANSFDTVISCETIEHVPDPDSAVRELARVLKPGGRLFLTTPNYLGPLGLYRLYLRLCGRVFTEEGQPINNFMLLPLVRACMMRAGLRIRRTDAVGHYFLFPGRVPTAVRWLNNPRFLMRWFGHHSIVVGRKP
ncbi:MAG: class I SAM-dependent methyltransferase [Vicinamibacterales bacterium]|nr:class I SAM-dependent methyltransferase [Vicinamibacterales bacterium]